MRVSLPAATAYTGWLVAALTDAAAAERAAAYRARLADVTPEPVMVRRFRCPHCGHSRAKETAAKAHMARCWQNPAVRACKSCVHFMPESEGPYAEHPPIPEECAVGAWPAGVEFPVVDCPSWEADR